MPLLTKSFILNIKAKRFISVARVARKNLRTQDFAIHHFKLSKEVTMVERLLVDEKGKLEKGIPDFLETDLDEFKSFLSTLRSD